MSKNKRMDIGHLIFEKVLPILSYVLFFASIVLQKLGESRMGVSRSLIYRNRILNNTIFLPSLMKLYSIIIILGLIMYFLIICCKFKRCIKPILADKISIKYFIKTIIISIISIVLLIFYNKVDLIGYPWITLSMLILLLVEYIRTIYILLIKIY